MFSELSYEDLTPAANAVLHHALHAASQRNMPEVEPPHVLLALLSTRTEATKIFESLGVDVQQLAAAITAQLPPVQSAAHPTPTHSAAAQQVVRAAFKEAVHLGHRRVDALHLLLGLLYDPLQPVAQTLARNGISLYEVRQQVLKQPRRFRVRQRDTLRAAVRPSLIFGVLVALFVGSGVALWQGPSAAFMGPITMVFVMSGWITSVCVHEFGHALAAFLGGDTSVRDAGYLTLNPLRYSHPFLSIVLPLFFLLQGGIGLPGGAVYIRPGALRSQRWEVITAAAGPIGTCCFLALIGWPFLFAWETWMTEQNFTFWIALAFLALLQVNAIVLNLLPIPPLDGFRILAPFLPQTVQQRALLLGNYGFLLLFMLFRSQSPLTDTFWQAVYSFAAWLHIPVDIAYMGLEQMMWWQMQ